MTIKEQTKNMVRLVIWAMGLLITGTLAWAALRGQVKNNVEAIDRHKDITNGQHAELKEVCSRVKKLEEHQIAQSSDIRYIVKAVDRMEKKLDK